jgi:hypothetical protein
MILDAKGQKYRYIPHFFLIVEAPFTCRNNLFGIFFTCPCHAAAQVSDPHDLGLAGFGQTKGYKTPSSGKQPLSTGIP